MKRKTYYRRVYRVPDGDSLFVTPPIEGERRIRLSGVDAPEYYQFGGKKAWEILKKLVQGKIVSITPVARDDYRRIVAIVKRNGKNINQILRNMGY